MKKKRINFRKRFESLENNVDIRFNAVSDILKLILSETAEHEEMVKKLESRTIEELASQDQNDIYKHIDKRCSLLEEKLQKLIDELNDEFATQDNELLERLQKIEETICWNEEGAQSTKDENDFSIKQLSYDVRALKRTMEAHKNMIVEMLEKSHSHWWK